MWCRPEGQNQGKDGIMDKKKPIGYTKEQTKSMKALIERTQEKAGDYVGSGTVTTVPKKKKKMPEKMPEKKMRGGGLARKGVGMALAKGGIVNAPARSYKDMRAGAGSGVGRIQKMKIAGRGR